MMNPTSPCHPPTDVPADYCHKLRTGIARLKQHVLAVYEKTYPEGRDWIRQAVADAEASAWETPFPSLFFLPLAGARITETETEIAASSSRDLRA